CLLIQKKKIPLEKKNSLFYNGSCLTKWRSHMKYTHKVFSAIFALLTLLAPAGVYADCAKCKNIYQKYFCEQNSHHHKTLKIRKSGKYCLGENIRYAPKHTNSAAILIEAD